MYVRLRSIESQYQPLSGSDSRGGLGNPSPMPSASKGGCRLLRLPSFYSPSAIQTDRSTFRISIEGLTSKVADRLNNVRNDGDFSPRSSCPMYVR